MDEASFTWSGRRPRTSSASVPALPAGGLLPYPLGGADEKKELPRGAGEEDRKRFATARSYMVRVDELVACRNMRCRKRFELTGQSVVLVSDAGSAPAGDFDPDTFGNR